MASTAPATVRSAETKSSTTYFPPTVVRLQVTAHDADGVRAGQRGADLRADAGDALPGQAPAGRRQLGAQRPPVMSSIMIHGARSFSTTS
jgi:hypothetical protein